MLKHQLLNLRILLASQKCLFVYEISNTDTDHDHEVFSSFTAWLYSLVIYVTFAWCTEVRIAIGLHLIF